ncbi:MurJ-like flippase [Gimesia panareensis]|uniref:MurJ-like flippase n=1 Tax=Gimesia panareensis TaxID=2527978 RepID=A0A518FM15_9PLAN|nr:lipid II flippase MurJ [Gimesia panareensis]QDV17394.1 MurJ-like flippase [Gimesia panareensis]
MSRSVSISALLVAIAMIFGRLTGLLRVLGLATVLGVSYANDLAVLMISVPDFLNAMLIGGAMAAVLVPEIHRRNQESAGQSASQLIVQTMLAVAVISGILALLLACVAPWFTRGLASGFSAAQISQASPLIMIVLWAFPLSTVTAVTGAVLQSQHKPLVPAYGNLFFNLILILAILFWVTPDQLSILAWAVVGAALFRLVTQLIPCFITGAFQGGFHNLLKFETLNRRLIVKYFQALTAIGLVIAFPVVSRSFASAFTGGISLFEYAQKLVELPRGLLGAILTMVIFPRLSHAFAEGKADVGSRMISQASGLILLISIPVTVVIYGCAEPMISLLFQRGQFSAYDATRTAELLQIAILSMPALIMSILTMDVFYARHETMIPFKFSLISLGCLVVLSLVLRNFMGISGVMLAFVLTSWFHFLMLTVGLHLKMQVSVIEGVNLKHCAALVLLTFSGIAISAMILRVITEPVMLVVYSGFVGLFCFGAVLLILRNHLPRFHRKLSL